MAKREDFIKFFHESDLDANGFLTFEELSRRLKGKGFPEEKIRSAFRQGNRSGGNLLSLGDFLYAMGYDREEKESRDEMMRRLFREFDRNGDGHISSDELKQVFEEMKRHLTEEEVKRMVALVDADQSGTIDYEEFMQHFFGKK